MKIPCAGFVLAFCFSMELCGQSCLTFLQPAAVPLYNYSSIIGLLQQPDGSYTAVTAPTSAPFSVQSVIPKYNTYVGTCTTPAPSMSFPSIPATPPQLGAASGIVAFGNFVESTSFPGVAFTATASPSPYISLGVIASGTGAVTNFPVPVGAVTVATADLNGDGHADLVVAVSGDSGADNPTGGVAILLGNGDGTFQTGAQYLTGFDTFGVTIADFNGDGKWDLAAIAFSGSITTLLGNGDGTFHAASTITAGLGQQPVSVMAADFNGDGKPDLASANEDGTVSILVGNGDGTFKTPQNFQACLECFHLAAGDFNKDGKLDLAINDISNSLVVVALGNGDGTFGAPMSYNTSFSPTGIILTDFNQDGNLDIVTGSGTANIITADFNSGDISVLFGNGDGTFQASPLYTTGGKPSSIATADLNGDGLPDLVTANQYSQNLTILLNQGKGKFIAAAPYKYTSTAGPISPTSVALADLNGDSKIDAVTAISSGSVAVSLGNGDGTFQTPAYYTTSAGSVMVVTGDLNGDGKPDLVVANGPLSATGSVSILLGSGGGIFKPAVNVNAGSTTVFVALSDVNGDGKLDLLVLNEGTTGSSTDGGGVMIFLGNGDGTFQTPVSLAVGTNPSALATADVNGDGKPDLLIATTSNFNASVAILLGKGDGTFQSPVLYAGQSGVTDIAVTDLNGDKKADIVLASCCGVTQAAYLLGNGDGTFQTQALLNGGPSPYFIAVGDYNGDGKPDLAFADQALSNRYGLVTLLLNTTASSSIVTASAAGGLVEPFAPDTIVAAYGTNLAAGTEGAPSLPLGTSLDGTTLTVTDALGVARPALLLYVSPTQINYEIPSGTAPGVATVTITSQNGTVQTGTIQVGSVSPGLFALNSTGLVAAWVLPITSGVQQNLEPVYQVNGSNAIVPLPINLNTVNTQYYLELYGSGIRNASNVTVTVGGVMVPVLFAGANPVYPGEDQVNIGPLPASLAGTGNANIVLTANGQSANVVNVTFQ